MGREAGERGADRAGPARRSGYVGASDGWTDLSADHRVDWHYDATRKPGNVAQIGGVLSTIPVVDHELGVGTPNGMFWHRYNFDGYGELPDGGPFGTAGNIGRLWPIFAGERGEYELLAGDCRSARERLRNLAATANSGRLMPEQVWDDNPPGYPGPDADVLGHAARLDARPARAAGLVDRCREPVDRPSVVARRYG